MAKKVYTDYFFDEPAYNTHDGGYIPLVTPKVEPQPLAIPPLLKPDRQTDTDDLILAVRQPFELLIIGMASR
ncbi:hypothetical protein WP50_04265 [Lactiplantibacillus plantarum]|nr:hypothetical protein WP50_04265 [Lactiplantibacillus plantarum]